MKVIRSLLKIPLIAVACVIGLASVAFAADAPATTTFSVFGISLTNLLTYVAAFIGAASAFAAALPTPSEGSVWWYLRKLLDWAALNIANAKNAVKS